MAIGLLSNRLGCGPKKITCLCLVWFITGAGKHLYVRNVGPAPLQRHPMVAVARDVTLSVQVTAVRVAQIRVVPFYALKLMEGF